MAFAERLEAAFGWSVKVMALPKSDIAHPMGRASAPIRVVVADDHTLVREGYKALLQLQAGVVVVAEIADGGELDARLAAESGDVLLLDQRLWLADGCDIRELREDIHVLLVGDDAADPSDAVRALRHGARGVVFRNASVGDLLEAIRAVAAGQFWMPRELEAQVAEVRHEKPKPTLTPREREIVSQVAVGMRNWEIGKVLSIGEQTVKSHLGHIFRKLGIHDRVGVALYAARIGLDALSKTER